MCQAIIFKMSVSITNRRAVMCELNLVKVQCVTVKLLKKKIIKIHKNCAKAITFNMSVVV